MSMEDREFDKPVQIFYGRPGAPQQRYIDSMIAREKPAEACPICKGSRFVCENHPRLAWPDECNCGAGDACPVCNVGEPPAMPDNSLGAAKSGKAGRR
jgi:hypothetical protein